MIYVTDNLAINFRHSSVETTLGMKNSTKRMSTISAISKSRRTECEILQFVPESDPNVVGYGESLCHPSDNFSKETGRKNSLNRAISHMSREDRALIWAAYHNRSKLTNSITV